MSEVNQFYYELGKLVKQWGLESDITVYEMIGALEATKQDLLEFLAKLNKE